MHSCCGKDVCLVCEGQGRVYEPKSNRCLLCNSTGMGHIGTLKKQAKRGHAWAQYYLGQRFLSGKRGAVQSDHDALRWIQKAAGQGHPFAFWKLGLWHQDGAAFCKRDLSIAAKYAEKILNADPRLVDYAGDLMASIALEYICDERFDEAIATLQPLSERGVSGAQHGLSRVYYHMEQHTLRLEWATASALQGRQSQLFFPCSAANSANPPFGLKRGFGFELQEREEKMSGKDVTRTLWRSIQPSAK